MVIRAIDAALEDREITFNCVRVCVAANILFDRVVNGLMAGEALADLRVNRALIGAKVRLLSDCVNQDRLQGRGRHVRNMARAYFAAALYERRDGFMLR